MSRLLLVACLLCMVVLTQAVSFFANNVLQQKLIVQKINNNPTTTWKAGINDRFVNMGQAEIKKLMGALTPPPEIAALVPVKQVKVTNALPATFDARVQWPQCPSIGMIRDQSSCGSCWAFGAVEAATDRICIETNATQQIMISANDLTACCSACGFGCGGGYLPAAWSYLTTTGIVSGGNYNDSTTLQWCQKYSLPNCAHHEFPGKFAPCPSTEYDTPKCVASCDADTHYTTSYAKDHHMFHSSYALTNDANAIAQEIYSHGPVEAAFTVYEDFLTYKSGVYVHQSTEAVGGHAVKLMGWGTENGQNYWLVANSWNDGWGNMGTFKIARGTDECGIESQVIAGAYLAQNA